MHGPTIACLRCARTVSAEAVRCPECGADPRTGESGFRGGERDRVRICEGVGLRLAAFAVDFVLLSAVYLAVGLLIYLILVGAGEFAVVGEEPPPWPLWVVFTAATFAYFWIGEVRYTRTLGKRFFELRVVRTDGGRLGYGAGFVRTLLRIVDWLPTLYLPRRRPGLADAAEPAARRPRRRHGGRPRADLPDDAPRHDLPANCAVAGRDTVRPGRGGAL